MSKKLIGKCKNAEYVYYYMINYLKYQLHENGKLTIKLHTDDDVKDFVDNVCNWMVSVLGYLPEYKIPSVLLFKCVLVHNNYPKCYKNLDEIAEFHYHTFYRSQDKFLIGMYYYYILMFETSLSTFMLLTPNTNLTYINRTGESKHCTKICQISTKITW